MIVNLIPFLIAKRIRTCSDERSDKGGLPGYFLKTSQCVQPSRTNKSNDLTLNFLSDR
jgi:hypothetical protein